MKYVRYQRFYGNSLIGGVDKAKIITVKEEVAKKKKGKNKDGKLVGIFVIIKLYFKFFAPIVFCVISQIQLRKIIFCREKKRNESSNRTIKNAKVCRLYNWY